MIHIHKTTGQRQWQQGISSPQAYAKTAGSVQAVVVARAAHAVDGTAAIRGKVEYFVFGLSTKGFLVYL